MKRSSDFRNRTRKYGFLILFGCIYSTLNYINFLKHVIAPFVVEAMLDARGARHSIADVAEIPKDAQNQIGVAIGEPIKGAQKFTFSRRWCSLLSMSLCCSSFRKFPMC